PSGKGWPVLRRAQRSRATRDLPRAGSPSRMASLPSAKRPGQSQATGREGRWRAARACVGGERGGGDMAGQQQGGEGELSSQTGVRHARRLHVHYYSSMWGWQNQALLAQVRSEMEG